jgi:outer membrane PBP1 activator LpoA protein
MLMMQPTTFRIARWLLLLILACSTACVNVPPAFAPSSGARPRGAAELARRGEHAQAAAAYEQLAGKAAAADQAAFELDAAQEWLAAGQPNEAARVLASLRAPLSDAQRYQRTLLSAQVSLAQRRPALAWRQISALAPPNVPAQAIDYYLLRMRIALAAARPVDGIQAEIAAEQQANPGQLQALRHQLLTALLQARAQGVRLSPSLSRDLIVRGWLELGATAQQPGALSLNSAAMAARWRAAYPNHPAESILAQAFPAPLGSAAPGARVALLLPLTGVAAADGATVRDGFLSAYYQLPPSGRPALHLYDTTSTTAGATQALAQARAAGSTFIVGPLLHDAVGAVAAGGSQSAPLLALNFLPDNQPAPAGFYQFALSPEDEARMVARRVLADGHQHGIVIVPRDPGGWGNQVAGAFARELTQGGGTVIAEASYDPNGHDYGDELRSVLRIDDSEARHQRLQRILGTKLNFIPRHRGDIQFVFIVPYTALNARLIEPQLLYFYASDIPSYSISQAYEPDSLNANRDIAGLSYPDMPWMIGADSSVAALRNTIGRAWGNHAAWQSRLFAFGYDACQLMLAMSAPYANPMQLQIEGLTGQLHFDADRRVQRQLIWVRVGRDGEPRPAASVPAPVAASAAAD